jgi:peroxiredoxin
VKGDDGRDVSLSEFRGKRVLLFFFPKANTTG